MRLWLRLVTFVSLVGLVCCSFDVLSGKRRPEDRRDVSREGTRRKKMVQSVVVADDIQ